MTMARSVMLPPQIAMREYAASLREVASPLAPAVRTGDLRPGGARGLPSRHR